jgi:GTP cyclohydrolase II
MRVTVFRSPDGTESVAIQAAIPEDDRAVPVRVHSACLTAEALGSLKCDCKSQLDYALRYISDHGGVVIYLPQEGRGVGLYSKIRAYALQDEGYDTVDANRELGLPDDAREYQEAARILDVLGIKKVALLTNNPLKIAGLEELGVTISERVPLPLMVTSHSVEYLRTKRVRMGHLLDFDDEAPISIEPGLSAQRPIVHANIALDEKGRTAMHNGEPLNLSCERDWCRVHELREHYSAVVVGARTWQLDAPCLTVREERLGRPPRRQPERVIFAGRHACEFALDQRRTFVVGSGPASDGAIRIEVHDHDLERPLQALRKWGLQTLLVEGGLTLLRSFIRGGYIDRLTIYVRTASRRGAAEAVQRAMPELMKKALLYEPFGEGVLVSHNGAGVHPRVANLQQESKAGVWNHSNRG